MISRRACKSRYRSSILYLDFESARPCILRNESERGQRQHTDLNSEKCDFQLPFSSKPSIIVAYWFNSLIKLCQVKNRKSSDVSANQTQLIKQPIITQSNWRNRCLGAGKRRQAVVGQPREKRSTCFRAILILFLWKTQILISHWEALVVFVCFYLSAVKLQ